MLPASSARSAVSERKNKYPEHHRRHPQGISYLVSWMLAFQISSILVGFCGFPSLLGGEMTAILEMTKLSGSCCILQNHIISLRLEHEKLVVWLCLSYLPCTLPWFCVGLCGHVLLIMSTQNLEDSELHVATSFRNSTQLMARSGSSMCGLIPDPVGFLSCYIAVP